eukprot:5985504-Prymnesium_polylepis.3
MCGESREHGAPVSADSRGDGGGRVGLRGTVLSVPVRPAAVTCRAVSNRAVPGAAGRRDP